jgi:hypothetical protein
LILEEINLLPIHLLWRRNGASGGRRANTRQSKKKKKNKRLVLLVTMALIKAEKPKTKMAAWPLVLLLLAQLGVGCPQRRVLAANSSLQSIISTPAGIVNYIENRQCSWLLQGESELSPFHLLGNRSTHPRAHAAPLNSTIMLWFDDYATECNYDFLFIYDGPSRSSPMLAALTGEIPFAPLSSSGDQVRGASVCSITSLFAFLSCF